MRRLKKGGILVMLAVLMGTATISCSYSNGSMSNGTIDTGNLHFVEADLTENRGRNHSRCLLCTE